LRKIDEKSHVVGFFAEKRQFNHVGVSGAITKPFNSLDLPEQVAKILDWSLER
jgi:hypothetical protein